MPDDRSRARNRGKSMERAVARRLNGTRNPSNGRGDEPDVSAGWLTVECKVWASLPARVESALKQAERTAKIGTLPIAVIKEKGRWGKNALVVMRMSMFEQYFGEVDDE